MEYCVGNLNPNLDKQNWW